MTDASPATMRVLIIDDNVTLGRVVSRLLEGSGHAARAVATVEAALALMDGAEGFRPQVILLDAVLGPASGLKAIGILAARGKAAIAVMSGHCDEELRRDATLLGAKAVLEKPLDFKALEPLLRGLAAGE